jgi:hypothetical protein
MIESNSLVNLSQNASKSKSTSFIEFSRNTDHSSCATNFPQLAVAHSNVVLKLSTTLAVGVLFTNSYDSGGTSWTGLRPNSGVIVGGDCRSVVGRLSAAWPGVPNSTTCDVIRGGGRVTGSGEDSLALSTTPLRSRRLKPLGSARSGGSFGDVGLGAAPR